MSVEMIALEVLLGFAAALSVFCLIRGFFVDVDPLG